MTAPGNVITFTKLMSWQLPDPLAGVGVKGDLFILAQCEHLAPRLQRAAFIVRGHRGD